MQILPTFKVAKYGRIPLIRTIWGFRLSELMKVHIKQINQKS